MPTIIALDVSLSMQRQIPGRSEENTLTYHQLALKGMSQLLEHLSSTSKLEYVSLITYSTISEVKVDFTRDYDVIRQAVKKVESGDKLCIISMLKNVASILSTNWGTQNYCQVVVFTDCGLGFGSTALKGFLQSYVDKENESEYDWITHLKTIKLNFICMGVHNDYYFTRAFPMYQQLIDFTGLKGQLYLPKPPKEVAEGTENTNDSTKSSANISANTTTTAPTSHSSHKSELGRTAMFELIERVCEANFKPYEVLLKVGGYFRLECPVLIWPPPAEYRTENGIRSELKISQKIEVCGYLSLSEIGSPASLSRHLVIPKVDREKPTRRSSEKSGSSKSSIGGNVGTNTKATLDVNQPNYEYEKLEQDIRDFYTKEAKDGDESSEDAEASLIKTSSGAVTSALEKESMCVLLHGAMKVENLAALVLLNDNWYGFLYSYADSKKKSNLMLNILPPGNNVIPWLGDLKLLGFAEDLLPGETSAFPVKADKRSYSQSCVVWIKQVSLQSDVQKVLRHAKKMPEKTQHFFKELNRIRRAALSIGFVELLEAMATLFEKESAQLTLGANPECSIQLKHAAIELRKPSNRDLKISIVPLQKFGASSSGTDNASSSVSGFVY
ncbi:PREDICTED: von Willebrand factor A domain-containing protein 9 isoform X1 [Rhagoletis zephyria]|uniref:von Willebrand factor A domain-containing protein 9 isoform X1 n=1 Tax=Rhagoletis zephyria TaxID=28612 RepID=UPI0008117EE7|nr:PREDICTED: von Willebrand factor A domain-containing protein 9 isoform X1 [Rhagoletis zephyria]XP_017469202.1 PREDICTED: von Willebrand factor A domain-containing protein 9 isoform X1 [Rhagoletis zephyria]XP_017469203.1 PREDICTED: von Willebrand factor A domain-containing protein 9 isoform X1 [Rhagoletis zephyria]